MSSLSQGPALRLRHKSRLDPDLIGYGSPELIMGRHVSPAAPGAVGQFLFVAPRACRITRIDYVADVNGAGASKVFLRNHAAGQTAAANAATSTTVITDVVTG